MFVGFANWHHNLKRKEDIFSKYERDNYEGEYPTISPEDWETIKETYPKDEVKEKLADIFMKYPLPYATDKYTIEDARDDYMKLKGIRYNELLKEEEWFPRKSRESKYPLTYAVHVGLTEDLLNFEHPVF